MNILPFQEHLTNDLIPFWNMLKDERHGGFYGYVNYRKEPDQKSVKGTILHSRILWFYSSAYQLLKDAKLLAMADHTYHFLSQYCYDSEYGGMYWSVNYDGTIADDTKHTYNQAFAIYALSAYYQASGRVEALRLAHTLYHIIEKKCRDDGGYLEAFHRDFTPTSNDKLSENGVMAERTMNTLLHVMEAYSELYKADGSLEVADSIRYILKLFQNKIYNSDRHFCNVFFDRDYHSLIDLESFGHDIEASWLIDRACQVLKDTACKDEMLPITKNLAKTVYQIGFDHKQHSLNNERENDKIDTQKIWWVQAEAVVGFYHAYQKEPHKAEYLQASEEVWAFIRQYMIDQSSGEWFESIPENNEPDTTQALVHPWKCPYHNGRMCIEMIQRLKGEQL